MDKEEREKLAKEQGKARGAQVIGGVPYVDIGLSVLWAECNVGAESPDAFGDYFAWGETETKTLFWDTNNVTLGIDMADIGGDVAHDAARARCGTPWRLPTVTEFEELLARCRWKWTQATGTGGIPAAGTQEKSSLVAGFRVTGDNGASLFLPAAGWRYGASLYDAGRYGCYWTSEPDSNNNQYAMRFEFDPTYRSTASYYRDRGRSIRPVASKDGL